jgi:hypothetical protein
MTEPLEHAPGWPYLTDEELERAREQWPAGLRLPIRAWRNLAWTQARYTLGDQRKLVDSGDGCGRGEG